MRVRWLRAALRNVVEIHDFIAQDRPAAARDTVLRIESAASQLGEYPLVGRPGRVPGTRAPGGTRTDPGHQPRDDRCTPPPLLPLSHRLSPPSRFVRDGRPVVPDNDGWVAPSRVANACGGRTRPSCRGWVPLTP